MDRSSVWVRARMQLANVVLRGDDFSSHPFQPCSVGAVAISNRPETIEELAREGWKTRPAQKEHMDGIAWQVNCGRRPHAGRLSCEGVCVRRVGCNVGGGRGRVCRHCPRRAHWPWVLRRRLQGAPALRERERVSDTQRQREKASDTQSTSTTMHLGMQVTEYYTTE